MNWRGEKHCSKGRGETQSQETTGTQDTTTGHVARGGRVDCDDGGLRVGVLEDLTSPTCGQASGLAPSDGQ